MKGWRLRWLERRNRLISNPCFQAWAARFLFTRPIARRHARELFDLTAGFVYSQVTAALVESGLLEALAHRPLSLAEAARKARLGEPATAILLKASAALDLTQAAEGMWLLGQRGAALAGMPGLADMIRHHRLLYADLADPLATLRAGRGRLADSWRYEEDADPAIAATYSALMAATQPMIAAQALAAYRFGRHSRLLDIGGGEGAFLEAVGARHPRLGLGLVDLPSVAERAKARLSRLGTRVTVHSGSFLTDPLPPGYDLHSLVRVLHDHDDDSAARLLAASRAALPAGGRLLIVEPMARERGAPEGHAYFGFYLAAMGQGRPRTPEEIDSLLRDAGFAGVRRPRTPIPLVSSCLLAMT